MILINSYSVSPPISYSAESLAFFARLSTQPSAARKAIYARLIDALIYAGVWAKLDALYILAASDAATARTNLKSSSYGLTSVGSPTFEADGGYNGDNTNNVYLETGFDPTVGTNNFTRNSASLFAYKNTNPSPDNGMIICVQDDSGYIQPYRPDGFFYFNVTGGANQNGNLASNAGLFAGSRIASNEAISYVSGIPLLVNKGGASSAPVVGKTVRILADQPNYGSTSQVAAAGCGGGLTAADNRNLYAAIQKYLSSIASQEFLLSFSSDVVNDNLGNYTPGFGRLTDGRLLCVYCVGTNQTNGKIVGKTSADNGKTWSASFDIAIPPAGQTYTDTSITVTGASTIIITFMQEPNDFSTNSVKIIRGMVAGDLSFTWSAPITVVGTNLATSSYVLRLANDSLMLGLYHYPGTPSTSVVFSTDDGLTWGGEVTVTAAQAAGDTFTESNFIQLGSGTIVGIIRNDNLTTPTRTGYWRTVSTNNGASWSVPTQVIGQVVAQAPSRPAPVLMPDGKIFLLTRFTNALDNNRTGYTWSTDEGLTWATVSIYYTIGNYSYGQHISAQGFYDTVTSTIMYALGQGSFSLAQVNFQQFYLP